MRIDVACFTYRDRTHGIIRVVFHHDGKGKPDDVVVSAGGKHFRVANTKGQWKPLRQRPEQSRPPSPKQGSPTMTLDLSIRSTARQS